MNEYNVWHINPYGLLIVAYFFLAGISGGAFLVSAFAKVYGKERYDAIVKTGAVIAIILISIAGICLWLDLARPMRVYLLLIKFNPLSPISWGGPVISLFAVCTLFYIYYLLIAPNDARARLFAKIGTVFALILTSYTGLLLSMAKARPLWHSAIMAPLFFISSCISGLALIMLVANILDKYSPGDDVLRILRRVMIIFIVIDIFFLSDMYVLYIGLSEAQEIALLLLVGEFAFLFLGVELLIGSVCPIIILSTERLGGTKSGQIAASVLSLVGVFTMRYIIVIIGQHFPLS
jgi:formate-dependent nitrite reductase membrane component NrfD